MSTPTHVVMYHGQPYARLDFIPQSRTKNLASDLVGVWFGSVASVATLDYCPRLARGKSGQWTCKQPCSIGSDSCVVNIIIMKPSRSCFKQVEGDWWGGGGGGELQTGFKRY